MQNDKELAKVEAMRARARERTQRFMNSRLRTMGVDKNYLDQQVKEKQISKINKKLEEQQDGNCYALFHYPEFASLFVFVYIIAVQIAQQIALLESEEQKNMEKKAKDLKELRNTLDNQSSQPKNNALANNGVVDLESCGAASVQVFEGEDKTFNSRKKFKQNQLREWISTQLDEKDSRLRNEKEANAAYDCEIISKNIESCRLADEEEQRQAVLRREVCAENILRAKQRKDDQEAYNRKKVQDDRQQSDYLQNNPFLCEDLSVATSVVASHRYRPDHFKGLNKEQLKCISQGNAEVLTEKRLLLEQQRQSESEWAQREQKYLMQLEKQDHIKYEKKSETIKIQMEELQLQRKELKAKQEAMKRDRFGEIGQGFFQGFGTSCR